MSSRRATAIVFAFASIALFAAQLVAQEPGVSVATAGDGGSKSAVDDVDCNHPLQGNTCIYVNCTACSGVPISSSGTQRSMNVTASTLSTVGLAGCTIMDVNDAVYLSHQKTGDINVQLQRGNDDRIMWTSSSCNSTTLNAIFDDEAGTQSNFCPPSGSMRPNDPLDEFDGKDVVANYTMYINGNGSTTGTLHGWKLALDAYCTTTPGGGGGGTCTNNATTVCLNNNRFKVQMSYTTAKKSTGAGHANSLTGDTGWFWFFNSANVESIIKVLTACGVNNKYWVYIAGLTDQGVTITVTDTNNGHQKVYNNPLGTPFQPIFDVNAFDCP